MEEISICFTVPISLSLYYYFIYVKEWGIKEGLCKRMGDKGRRESKIEVRALV